MTNVDDRKAKRIEDVRLLLQEFGKVRLTPLSRPQNWKNKVDAPALNIDSQ